MSSAGQQKTMLYICMHPLNNVPPPLNAAIYFGSKGYRVIVLCYYDTGLSPVERLGSGARLLRMHLSSRNIRIAPLRYFFAITEFLWKSIVVLRRLKPDVIITFNEIASILQRVKMKDKRPKQLAWLLEFPENIQNSFGKSLVFKWSIRSWKYADAVIAPTNERLAMSCVLQPRLIEKKLFIIHNASLNRSISNAYKFSSGYETVKQFAEEQSAKRNIKIIYAGAIGNRYGFDQLIRAVGNSNLPISLLILGKKHELSLREYDEALLKTQNKERIQWIDSIDYREMNLILPWFDVGYVTYIGDTLNTYFAAPGKVYEYLKAGLIILADSGINIYDDLLRYNCGIFFEKPATEKELSIQLAKLASTSEVNEMRANARNLFLDKYSFENQVVKLEAYLAG